MDFYCGQYVLVPVLYTFLFVLALPTLVAHILGYPITQRLSKTLSRLNINTLLFTYF